MFVAKFPGSIDAMTAGPVNGNMASGPRRPPRNTPRPARIVGSVSEALPIAGVYKPGSYRDGYAARQERFGWKPAGLRVQVSLDKPQLLVGLAADLGEHIRRVGIAEPFGLIDCLARGRAECRQSRRQCIDMFPFRDNVARVAGQRRTLCYGVYPAL